VRICTFNLIALANQESAIVQAQPRFVKHNLTQSQQWFVFIADYYTMLIPDISCAMVAA